MLSKLFAEKSQKSQIYSSKNSMNKKIVFVYASEHFAFLGGGKWPLLEGRGERDGADGMCLLFNLYRTGPKYIYVYT